MCCRRAETRVSNWKHYAPRCTFTNNKAGIATCNSHSQSTACSLSLSLSLSTRRYKTLLPVVISNSCEALASEWALEWALLGRRRLHFPSTTTTRTTHPAHCQLLLLFSCAMCMEIDSAKNSQQTVMQLNQFAGCWWMGRCGALCCWAGIMSCQTITIAHSSHVANWIRRWRLTVHLNFYQFIFNIPNDALHCTAGRWLLCWFLLWRPPIMNY